MSEALVRAKAKYYKNHIKTISFQLHREKDAELIKWIDSQENKTGYIKNLVIEDMKKRSQK